MKYTLTATDKKSIAVEINNLLSSLPATSGDPTKRLADCLETLEEAEKTRHEIERWPTEEGTEDILKDCYRNIQILEDSCKQIRDEDYIKLISASGKTTLYIPPNANRDMVKVYSEVMDEGAKVKPAARPRLKKSGKPKKVRPVTSMKKAFPRLHKLISGDNRPHKYDLSLVLVRDYKLCFTDGKILLVADKGDIKADNGTLLNSEQQVVKGQFPNLDELLEDHRPLMAVESITGLLHKIRQAKVIMNRESVVMLLVNTDMTIGIEGNNEDDGVEVDVLDDSKYLRSIFLYELERLITAMAVVGNTKVDIHAGKDGPLTVWGNKETFAMIGTPLGRNRPDYGTSYKHFKNKN